MLGSVQSAVACTRMQPERSCKNDSLAHVYACIARLQRCARVAGVLRHEFAESAGIFARSPKLPYTPQHYDRPLTDQPAAGSWPDWPGRCREGALLVPLCAGEKSIAPRPRRAAPTSQTPQRVQRNASNTNAQQHQKHQTTKCRPAATRIEVPRRRRATPSRRRLHVIGRASSPGLHKLRGRPPRRRSLR